MSNSVTGQIDSVFNNSGNAATLRSLVKGFYADIAPGEMKRPFVVVGEAGTKLQGQARNTPYPGMIQTITVRFTVYGQNRPQVENILDQCQVVFLATAVPGTYTWDNYTYLGTYFANRMHDYDGEGWMGILELDLQRSGQQ